MRTRPILFIAPMVRALLDGSKTQTRRPFNARTLSLMQAAGLAGLVSHFTTEATLASSDLSYVRDFCPYGKPGDLLWVREAFSGPHCMEASKGRAALPPRKWPHDSALWYWADGNPSEGDWTRPRPIIHMPRWASRITLEIVSVRVERLTDISMADAEAEGVIYNQAGNYWQPSDSINCPCAFPYGAYMQLWESINGPGSWAANPWVWVVEFKAVKP